MPPTEALHSRFACFQGASPLHRADSSEKTAIQCAYRRADGRRTCLLCRYLRGILNADIKKTKACVASPASTFGRGRRLVHRQAGVAIALECLERTCARRCARAVAAIFASTPREKHHAVLKAGRKNNVLSIVSIRSRSLDFPHPERMMYPAGTLAARLGRRAKSRSMQYCAPSRPANRCTCVSVSRFQPPRTDPFFARCTAVEFRLHTMKTIAPRGPFHFSNNALCFFPKKRVMIAA